MFVTNLKYKNYLSKPFRHWRRSRWKYLKFTIEKNLNISLIFWLGDNGTTSIVYPFKFRSTIDLLKIVTRSNWWTYIAKYSQIYNRLRLLSLLLKPYWCFSGATKDHIIWLQRFIVQLIIIIIQIFFIKQKSVRCVLI